MKKNNLFKNRKKRAVPFNPDRSYLNQAIDEFLAEGGRISVVVPDEKSFKTFVEEGHGLEDVDNFLLES